MADEKEKAEGGDDQYSRMALGTALGTPIGVALSLILDNWAMIGVGIALGAGFGAIPVKKKVDRDESSTKAD
jgi:uncharacterized ferredoxin-like protein